MLINKYIEMHGQQNIKKKKSQCNVTALVPFKDSVRTAQ